MLYEAIFNVCEHNVKVGLAVTLGTPVTALEPVISRIEAVLLLSRVTGEGTRGASFDPLVLPRVRRVREMVETAGVTVDIQVAGGVKRDHIPELIAAGATTLAMGGGIYRVPDMAREVAEMRALTVVKS
jgi:ribulose-phosphate 3-epimerase